MKKLACTFTFLIAVFFGDLSVSAQQTINLFKNDSLFVELDGYKLGDIYWEYSVDKNASAWNTDSQNTTTLSHQLTTPYYFRSRIVDGTCNPIISGIIQANTIETQIIKAGHGYVESAPFIPGSGINMEGNGSLSGWFNQDSKAVWFLYQTAGTYQVKFRIKSLLKRNLNFEMKTSQAYELGYAPETFPFTCSTGGVLRNDTIPVFTITVPKTGYYRYELTAKNSMIDVTLDELLFDAVREPGTIDPDAHTTQYLSSPSVHLSFSSTAGKGKYDWIYEEILVPEGYDPLATYWMSLGFFSGYMGIQTNSLAERRVLFSVWDMVDRDKYPDAPKELLVELVDKAPYTQANDFGNEGTGGQSYVGTNNPDTWKTGTPVKFLMNARPDSFIVYKGDTINHVLISAWYNAGDDWKYVATWRAKRPAGQQILFDGFYSFIENYGYANGQVPRKGYYYNAFGKESDSGNWIHFNKVGFSNTDGTEGQRIDYEQGVDNIHPDKFYMLSGGYGPTKKSQNTLPLLSVENAPSVRDLNLTPFKERVDEAIKQEIIIRDLKYMDKTRWSVTGFSSQETSGEGSNGRAAQIIDRNDNTYWHTEWSNETAQLPHWVIVDMGKEETNIDGFKFVHSGRQDRKMKDIKIEVSNSPNGGWVEAWSRTAVFAPDLIYFATPVTGRYFKLTVNSTTATDGPHINVFEIYGFRKN